MNKLPNGDTEVDKDAETIAFADWLTKNYNRTVNNLFYDKNPRGDIRAISITKCLELFRTIQIPNTI